MPPITTLDPAIIEQTLTKAHQQRLWRRLRLGLFSLITLASLVFTVSLLIQHRVPIDSGILPAVVLQMLAVAALCALWTQELNPSRTGTQGQPVLQRLCEQQRLLGKTLMRRQRLRLILGLITPALFFLAVTALGSERIDSSGLWGLGFTLFFAWLLAMAGMSWEIGKIAEEIRQLTLMRDAFSDIATECNT